jgi:glycine cleavage system H protein
MFPDNLRYTRTHEWVRQEGDSAVMGITDHAQHELGDIVYLDLPAVGKAITAQGELGAVESVKAASDLYSPVTGTVIAINEKAVKDSSIVNKDPYGEGWMIKVKLSNPSELDSLLTAAQYKTLLGE